MSTTINAGNATSGAAISADTTGILQLQSGSTPTTAVTIDASQNVGIGTASPQAKLVIEGGTSSDQFRMGTGANYYKIGRESVSTGYLNFYGTQSGANGYVFGGIDGERMRIDSSGNVGIGTSSPTYKLDVAVSQNYDTATRIYNANAGSSARATIVFGNNSNGGAAGILYNSSTNTAMGGGSSLNIYNGLSAPITFQTSATEAMRINPSGYLLLGTTTQTGTPTNGLVFGPEGAVYMGHPNGTVSGSQYANFNYNGGSIGSITQNGTTAVSYNTTSDYRLKTDVTPIQNALATVNALNPDNFTWTDVRKDDGFLAHEIQAIIPNCVTGEKDAVNEDGTPKYQQMDNSGVIPFLVKAIQELNAKVDAQALEIQALKGAA